MHINSRLRAALLGCALLSIVAPAHADHPGPSAGGSTQSGGLQVGGAETLAPGRYSVGLVTTFAKPQRRSDETLRNLAGQHIHAHASDYSLRSALEVGYGLSERLTLSAILPMTLHDDFREGEHSHGHGGAVNSVVQRGSVGGIGDASLLAKYRLAKGLALLAGIKAPTGSTRKRDNLGERFETEHQPGSGSWDALLGAAAGTRVGSLQLDASLMYQLAGKGAMRTQLGDRGVAGVALSRRFQAADVHEPGEVEAHGHSSWDGFVELTAELERRQRVAGEIDEHSGSKALLLSPGVRFNSATEWSATAQFGLPVWQRTGKSHADTGYRLAFALARTF